MRLFRWGRRFSTLRTIYSLDKSLRPSGFEKSLSHRPILFTCQLSTFWKCLFLLFHALFVVTDAARRSDLPAVRGDRSDLRRRICEYFLCQLRLRANFSRPKKVPSVPVSIVSRCLLCEFSFFFSPYGIQGVLRSFAVIRRDRGWRGLPRRQPRRHRGVGEHSSLAATFCARTFFPPKKKKKKWLACGKCLHSATLLVSCAFFSPYGIQGGIAFFVCSHPERRWRMKGRRARAATTTAPCSSTLTKRSTTRTPTGCWWVYLSLLRRMIRCAGNRP